jgi:small-conductance mechanosensitive channel
MTRYPMNDICIQLLRPVRFFLTGILLFLLPAIISNKANAQKDTSIAKVKDSTPPGFSNRVKAIMEKGAKESQQDFERERTEIRQQQLINELEKNTLKAKAYLKHRLDTLSISRDLNLIEKWTITAGIGVFSETSNTHSYRNLVTTSKILHELLDRVTIIRQRIDLYEKELGNFRFIADSLNADPAIYRIPEDSASIMEFLGKYSYMAQGLHPVDSILTATISGLNKLQARINYLLYQINGDVEELDVIQRKASHTFFSQHFPYFLVKDPGEGSLNQSVAMSSQKTNLLLWFYSRHHIGKFFLLLLLSIASFFFLYSLKRTQAPGDKQDATGRLVLRYPYLSGLFLVLNLFQFIFPDPPFAFNMFFWFGSAVLLAIIFAGFIDKFWMRFWLAMIVLFVLSSASNLLLQSSLFERVAVLLTSVVGAIISLLVLLSAERKKLREKLILLFVGLAFVLQVLAIIANLTGRFNLAKALSVCAYCNVIIGICFLWTVRLINEGLTLAASVYVKQSPALFYVNFRKVGNKAPVLLYLLLIVGWLILLGRNFYEFRLISEPLKDFLSAERTVGDYSFSISKIFIFFGIMALAVISSRITSYFASDKHLSQPSTGGKKAGLGSWLLLVRVIIISAGLFLALAASGFPLDRITILVGALGVGVGLGLQGLVNNLVSGLIIAFDRPVNVGDFIEVSGHAGTVKSVGFRSSVLSAVSGGDVVIPNGDLLNSHLINWTLGGNKRQMEVAIGVAYGSDLKQVKSLLLDLFRGEERVLEYPAPVVLFDAFGNSAINTRLLFWVKDYRNALTVKSEMIIRIEKIFEEKGIDIPFPQHQIYIKDPLKPDEKQDKK